MHGYNEVSNYTLYKQWQCIIQLLLPIPCWCINCESYVRILYAVMHDAGPSLIYLCGLVCGLVKLEQNSSCAVALSCVTLVRRYLSLRSCLRSCGQVLGTPAAKGCAGGIGIMRKYLPGNLPGATANKYKYTLNLFWHTTLVHQRWLLSWLLHSGDNQVDLQVATYYVILTERLLTVCWSTVWTSSVLESRTNRRSKKKQQQQMIQDELGADEAKGPCGPASPWKSPFVWQILFRQFLKELTVLQLISCCARLFQRSTVRSEKKDHLRSRWQWCFAILAEWPLVLVALMSASKCSKGIVDSPLYKCGSWK